MNKDYAMSIRNKLRNNDLIMVPSATVLPFDKNKVLLQKRSDTKTWGTIGGGIQYNEKIEDTAKRELFEETNLEPSNLKAFGVYSLFPIKYINGDEVNAFTIAFICNLKKPYSFMFNNDETDELKWFSADEINNIDFWNETAKEIVVDSFEIINEFKMIIK